MGLQFCQKCQKEVPDEKAVIRDYEYFCPVCHSQLVYFGAEDSQVESRQKLDDVLRDKQKMVSELKGSTIQVQRDFGVPPQVLASQELIKREPGNQKALLFLAHYFKSVGKIDQSMAYYEQLLAQCPDSLEIYQEKADLHFSIKDLSGAITTLEGLSKIDTENCFVFYNLGLVYHRNNQPQDAKTAFERAYFLNQDPVLGEKIQKILRMLSGA